MMHYHTAGDGHLDQGRFSLLPVQNGHHFLVVCRYVERNAYTAGLCDAPDPWRFGSLWRWAHGTTAEKSLLAAWPVPLCPRWIDFVAAPLTDNEQQGNATIDFKGRALRRRDMGHENGPTSRSGIDTPRSWEAQETAQIPILVPDTFSCPDRLKGCTPSHGNRVETLYCPR